MSIVMPVFNGRQFLAEAVDSVDALRDEVSLELVVADGASTDGTVDLLRSVPFARGVSAPDSGVYEALNRAVKLARGRYIQWLNADDVLGASFIPQAIALLEQAPDHVGLVLGNTIFIDSAGGYVDRWTYDPQVAIDFRSHAQGTFYNVNSALFRADLLRRAGAFDQVRFPLAADRDFEFRICRMSCEARAIDETSYFFRRHANSLTGNRSAWASNLLANAALYEYWAGKSDLPATWRTLLISSHVEARLMAACFSLKYPRARRLKAFKAALAETLRHPNESARFIGKKVSERLRQTLTKLRKAQRLT